MKRTHKLKFCLLLPVCCLTLFRSLSWSSRLVLILAALGLWYVIAAQYIRRPSGKQHLKKD